MATKTITIEEDVYEMLKNLKTESGDSFSKVIRRNLRPRRRGVAAEFLLRLAERPEGLLGLTEEEVAEIERARLSDLAGSS